MDSYQWPTQINRYSQKFFGLDVITFIAGAACATVALMITISAFPGGLGGIVFAAFNAVFFGVLAILSVQKFERYGTTLPFYLFRRLTYREYVYTPPMITSGDMTGDVDVMDWNGQIEGVIQ